MDSLLRPSIKPNILYLIKGNRLEHVELCPLHIQAEEVDGRVAHGQEEGVDGEALHGIAGPEVVHASALGGQEQVFVDAVVLKSERFN